MGPGGDRRGNPGEACAFALARNDVIRRRDEIRLCVQKLGLRKRRAAFAIVSVALGIVVVVAVRAAGACAAGSTAAGVNDSG